MARTYYAADDHGNPFQAPGRPPRRPRLTPQERELLARAARFVLAGEWPWDGDDPDEQAVLARAADKIEGD